MFKKFILLLILPTVAFAFPSVGDVVRYEANYKGDAVIIDKSILSHDSVNDTFRVHTTVTYKNEIIDEKEYDAERLFFYDESKVQDVLDHCEEREGALSNVSIMQKTVQVCEFYDEDSQLTYMIGKVPFGQVRFQEYLGDEEFLDFYLTRFQ